MELYIKDKIEFPAVSETRVYVSKMNADCTKSSVFTVVFKDGAIVNSFENQENRVGLGLKIFKSDLEKLQKTGIENLNPFDCI